MTRLFVLLALAPALIADIAIAAPTPSFKGTSNMGAASTNTQGNPPLSFARKPPGTFGVGSTIQKSRMAKKLAGTFDIGNTMQKSGMEKKPAGTFGTLSPPKLERESDAFFKPTFSTNNNKFVGKDGSPMRNNHQSGTFVDNGSPKRGDFVGKDGSPVKNNRQGGRVLEDSKVGSPSKSNDDGLPDFLPKTRGRSGTIIGDKKVEQVKNDKNDFPEDIFGPMVVPQKLN